MSDAWSGLATASEAAVAAEGGRLRRLLEGGRANIRTGRLEELP